MTTIAIRKKIHEFIDNIEEKKAKAIYTMFEGEIKQGERISLEQYNKEIDEAEAEFEKGDYVTHAAIVKKIKQW